jgi:hypothetical protein
VLLLLRRGMVKTLRNSDVTPHYVGLTHGGLCKQRGLHFINTVVIEIDGGLTDRPSVKG